MDKLKDLLNIDETFTKPIRKSKVKTKISDVVTLLPNFNEMADILFLPETKVNYHYLLVMVDLATHEFDIEPLKTKSSDEVLNAMKRIFKRPYVKLPEASLRTDNGTEFMGAVSKFLKDKKIFHSVSMPYRHSQLSMVESLNKTLGLLFNGYMNSKEIETGQKYKEWTDVVDIVRTGLNKIRKTKPPYTDKTIYDFIDKPVDMKTPPKFETGQLVHYKLSYPENALGHKQPTEKFRMGDFRFSAIPKKIMKIFYYSGAVPYRYQLFDMPYVSFTEAELMPSKETVEKFIVKKIVGKKVEKKKSYYLVWWKNYPKSQSTWELKTQLIEDGLIDYIDEFEKMKK